MKLLNFSIGKVQTVQIGSELVRTAHIKEPVAQPWVITADGADGDQRAVHPDKIYAYARTGYEYWGTHLKRDPTSWPDGFFGENLTSDLLNEDDLRIGDVLEIGQHVRLVVAGPRNPCLKLSWRLGQPPTFQKIFRKSHHTGVYFGVLAAGTLQPGDAVSRVRHDPTMPTVAEVAQFAAGHSTPPLESLKRVLDFEHLSRTIRHILHAKWDAAERAAETSEGRWRGWRTFRIDRIAEEAPGIRSFYLRAGDSDPLCRPRPGQFVTIQMESGNGEPISRCWSLSSYAHITDHYRITVRRQAGAGSNWMHAAEVGAAVKLRAPAGEFVLDMGGYRPVVLIAAGIGITPLLAMLHAHLSRGDAGAPVYLIYGARTPAAVAFREELDRLVALQPKLHVTYVYSGTHAGARPAGRITSQLLLEVLADLHVMLGDRRVALPWFEHDAYICGPGDFCRNLKNDLIACGANADHIFYELFSVAPANSTSLEVAEVYFNRSGVSCIWNATEDLTLLELAEKAGIEVQSDCRAGACLTCKSPVIEGSATSDRGDGSALLCIGRPASPVLRLDR
jgi:uncharacterized protein